MPDAGKLPKLHYRDYWSTLVTKGGGDLRDIDDFQPGVQLKELQENHKISSEDREMPGVFHQNMPSKSNMLKALFEGRELPKAEEIRKGNERKRAWGHIGAWSGIASHDIESTVGITCIGCCTPVGWTAILVETRRGSITFPLVPEPGPYVVAVPLGPYAPVHSIIKAHRARAHRLTDVSIDLSSEGLQQVRYKTGS